MNGLDRHLDEAVYLDNPWGSEEPGRLARRLNELVPPARWSVAPAQGRLVAQCGSGTCELWLTPGAIEVFHDEAFFHGRWKGFVGYLQGRLEGGLAVRRDYERTLVVLRLLGRRLGCRQLVLLPEDGVPDLDDRLVAGLPLQQALEEHPWWIAHEASIGGLSPEADPVRVLYQEDL